MPIDAIANLFAKFWAFLVIPIYVWIRDSLNSPNEEK